MAATQGKTFAVIADEAHSSQTGEAAAKLKEVLSAEEVKALEDGGEISTEDLLAAQMSARASDRGVSYFAFTATPKPKTMELFGRRPKPDQPAGPDNLPAPFHVYSMRQAIEEGFILDVLRNYTPYKLAFRLAHNGKEIDEKEVERDAAMKGIMRLKKLFLVISQRQVPLSLVLEPVVGELEFGEVYAPLTETGSGAVQDKEKGLLSEIISRVNDLFEGDLSDDDRLIYVNNVLKGKLLESETLVEQAANNTKEQFAASPDLSKELLNAIMDALEAHTSMSNQALNSERVREGLKDVLLGPAQLYEALRERSNSQPSAG